MPKRGLPQSVIDERLREWIRCGRSSQKAAKSLGLGRRTFDHFLNKYANEAKHLGESIGRLEQCEAVKRELPETGCKRYILTCAQDSTSVHRPTWDSLLQLAGHLGAEIMVSQFTYNRTRNTKDAKPGTKEKDGGMWWAEEILPYSCNQLTSLSPKIAFCGNLQISPTATNPVSGLHDYTGTASAVVPHVKIRMEPVGTPVGEETKHIYTTGTVTIPAYIQAKAGQKAEFHHTFGALLVAVLPDGNFFARQLVSDDDGVITDCGTGIMSTPDGVYPMPRPMFFHPGDIHERNMDEVVREMYWGEGGALDTLRPEAQLFHDLVDAESHNHHAKQDHHEQYRLYRLGLNDVQSEYDDARHFVDEFAHRDWCESYTIASNHDKFLQKYLQYTDYRRDPANAVFILKLELEAHLAMDEGREPELFKRALSSEKTTVLDEDSTLKLGGIDCNHHGHAGANGSRGSVQQFSKSGAKTTTGHSHAAWWINGATSAGTCTRLNMGYNKAGLSTWSHSFVVCDHRGKRQIVTANAAIGKWHE